MIDLDPDQAASSIATLLKTPESQTLEFKRVSGKMVGKALETICAFANTEGGMLVLGVSDPSTGAGAARLQGIQENPEALDELRRKVLTQLSPPVERLRWIRLPCTLNTGNQGHVVVVRVEKSDKVHSIVDDGTWTRLMASNREMSAGEIADLHYRRGVRSAVSEPVAVALELLRTDTWRRFASARGLKAGTFADQLQRIGLAAKVGNELQPTRAAVLLFAEEPGSLLAAHDTRADIRLMVYDGKAALPGATPNLRKAAKTIRGPLIDQIDEAAAAVLDELAQGLTLSGSGFKTRHVYPERVVKEAIVNAVIHRDYRLNRDIFIRIFDDRIEVESPGVFPGSITSANIGRGRKRDGDATELGTPERVERGKRLDRPARVDRQRGLVQNREGRNAQGIQDAWWLGGSRDSRTLGRARQTQHGLREAGTAWRTAKFVIRPYGKQRRRPLRNVMRQ